MTTGTIEHQLRKVTQQSEKCLINDFSTVNNKFHPLYLNEYIGVNIILLLGYTISLMTFCTESMINYIFNNKDGIRRLIAIRC